MGVKVPVLLGGAALDAALRRERICASIYEVRCYYGKDAFEGLRICEHLADDRLATIDEEIDARLDQARATSRRRSRARESAAEVERERPQGGVARRRRALERRDRCRGSQGRRSAAIALDRAHRPR